MFRKRGTVHTNQCINLRRKRTGEQWCNLVWYFDSQQQCVSVCACANSAHAHPKPNQTTNMISGSSEQLLEQQQQELRNRKLKELAPKKKTPPVKKVSWRERLNFYATSTLAFFSVTAGASLLFLVPLYVDPAISTLASDFIDQPTWCITTRAENVVGLMNCSWSSCREGCTSDLYRCTHIYVTYFLELENETLLGNLSKEFFSVMDTDSFATRSIMSAAAQAIGNMSIVTSTSLSATTTTTTTATPTSAAVGSSPAVAPLIMHGEEAVLMVNIKGCGHRIGMCKNFSDLYGEEDQSVFPCYYSRSNRTLVLTEYDEADQWSIIVNFFFVPFAITLISSVGLCVLHCDCSCQKERPPRQRSRGGGEFRDREPRCEHDIGSVGGCRGRGGDGGAGGASSERHFCRRPRLDNLR